MKILIVYSSQYKGHTEKIAGIFAEKTNGDMLNVKEIDEIRVENYDLIGFGSGVYVESLSPKLLNLVESLNLKDKDVFVFSTSGVGMKFYNKRLINLLKSKGALVKGSFACKGSFTAKEFTDNKFFDFLGKLLKGHPNESDFKDAEKFIIKLMDSVL